MVASAPCFNHFQKRPDRGHSSNDVSFPSPAVGDDDAGPREREEFLKGFEEYTP